jgi:hypothetical protein
MPRTSIETGDVDFILPLEKIAAKLIKLVGAGKKSGRGRAPKAAEKSVTPRYAAGSKAAMLTREK